MVLFLCWMLRIRKPSFYGGVFCLLCVYIPLSIKIPFALFPGGNLLNAFYVVLFFNRQKPETDFKSNDKLLKQWLIWGFACIIAVSVSLIFHENYGQPFISCKRWFDTVLLYYFARQLHSNRDRQAALDGIVMGTVLFSLHLALQGLDIGNQIRLGGLFDDPNTAAAFVAAYSAVIVSLFCNSRNPMVLLGLAAILIVCVYAEFQTVSRAGIAGMVLGTCACFLYAPVSKKMVILTITIIALIVQASVLPDKIMLRFDGQDMHGYGSEEALASTEIRFEIWKAAVAMGLANPIGVGMDRFKAEVSNYGGPEMRDAHNTYLLIWGEMGFSGLLIFLLLILKVYKQGIAGWCRGVDAVSKFAGQTLVGSLTALLFTNFFSVTFRDPVIFGYIAILASLILIKNDSAVSSAIEVS